MFLDISIHLRFVVRWRDLRFPSNCELKMLGTETQTETIKLKVGRAVNIVKRIDQWGKQCGSKEQVLRGFFPGTVEPDEDGNDGSLMKGRLKAGEKGPWCHRLGTVTALSFSRTST